MNESNNRGHFIAIATFHDQPPFETPAKTWHEAKRFDGTDELADVWHWITSKTGIPNSLEIMIEDNSNE